MKRIGFASAALALTTAPAVAHGFGGAGWMHPLTGPDHMLAMLAVGAWSAQLGGRALWLVPSAFVVAMAAGGAAALAGLVLPATEVAIVASVILLGLAIASARPYAVPVAAFATMVFGLAHGSAHGAEIPASQNVAIYVAGFLATTAGLHVIGLAGAALVLDRPNGATALRAIGAVVIVAGLMIAGWEVYSTGFVQLLSKWSKSDTWYPF